MFTAGRHPRLHAIAGLVPPGSRVADIGSGHGMLPRLLLASGTADHCIATERSASRLREVRRFPRRHPAAARLELRHGDGLRPLRVTDGLDVIVISGVGARAIERIVGDPRLAELAVDHLVLQPQTEWARLRRWLARHGWTLAAERLIREGGRTYLVLAATAEPGVAPPRHPALDADDLFEAGPLLVQSRDPLVRRFWRGELERRERFLRSASAGPARRRARRARDQARRILDVLPIEF